MTLDTFLYKIEPKIQNVRMQSSCFLFPIMCSCTSTSTLLCYCTLLSSSTCELCVLIPHVCTFTWGQYQVLVLTHKHRFGRKQKPPPAGEHFLIRVIGARGDSHVWSLRFEGLQAVDTPGGSVRALRFLREPEGPQDTRAEFWLDPARQYLPVRARLTDGSSDAFELLRLN